MIAAENVQWNRPHCKLPAMSRLTRAFIWVITSLMLSDQRVQGADKTADSTSQHARQTLVYVGTFTWNKSKGVYLLRLDPSNGSLTRPELVGEAPSPSFLALHPSHKFLYAVNEMDQFQGKPGGAVTAFSIDSTSGKLAILNQQSSDGGSPTHISLDRDGRNALVANYGTGTVAVLPIQTDGKLSPVSSIDQHTGKGTDPRRQNEPHAHCVNVDPSGRFALSCDLGLDKVFIYRLEGRQGKLIPNRPPFATVSAGTGPRHLAFHPGGKFLYVVGEMKCTVTVFGFDANSGTLMPLQTIPAVREGFSGEQGGAEIAVHRTGKFLYLSDRGDDNSIYAFSIDASTGKLSPIGQVSTGGKHPRSFGIDPTGRWLLAGNQDTNNVVEFAIDQQTGRIKPTGVEIEVPTPVSFAFLTQQ